MVDEHGEDSELLNNGGGSVNGPARNEGGAVVDELLDRIGTSRLQWECVGILGLANASDAVEVLAIGFIITVFKDPTSGKSIDELAFWSGLLTSGVFIGMLFGGLVSGRLGDRYGRKPMLCLSLVVNSFAALVSALTPLLPNNLQVGWLVFWRFVGGLGVGGSVPSAFALGAELSPSHARSFFINIIACFWPVGVLYTSLCAWLILSENGENRWPWFAVTVSLPAAISAFLCLRRLEESPMFLWSAGDKNALRGTLSRFVRSSSSLAPSARNDILSQIDALNPANTPGVLQRSTSLTGLLFGGTTRKHIVLISLIFFALSFAHYGISSWISDLFKKVHFTNPYTTSLFYTLASVPGLLCAIYFVDRMGRRNLLAWSMGVACASALLFAVFSASTRTMILLCAALFNASAASSWNALDVFSAELLPSEIRGTGLGIATASGRVGSILANICNSIILADKSRESTTSVAMVLTLAGISMIAGAICTVNLPETMRPLST